MNADQQRLEAMARRSAETGVDEELIERLVRAFYGKVRNHPVLGPVFNARIDDWEHHMSRLCAFWSSIILASGTYGGSPMQKHLGLPVDGRHFDLWLALFGQTLHEECTPSVAALFMERARRIAESLEMAIAGEHDMLLSKGERLRRPDIEVYLAAE